MDQLKEKEIIEQHKADAQKTIKDLETLQCNVSGVSGDFDWDNVVKTRKKHCEAFITGLEVQEKQFEHFK